MLKRAEKSLFFALLAGLASGHAFADDANLSCCADLEARIKDLEALSAEKGSRKVSLNVSGLVSWPIMIWDDGRDRDAFVVSNEVKRPRLRFAGEGKIDATSSAGFVFEIGPNPNPRAPMDQHDFDSSAGPLEIRHSYWWLKNKDLGQISFGQQSQATDFATEVTLANTTSVMSPGIPILLGYVTRGWFMRRDDGVLTNVRFGDILFRGRNDIWGEGHRWGVVRYDSPAFAGFTVSASWGEDDAKDAALRYSGTFGRIKVAAALGVSEWTDGAGQRGCAKVATGPSDVRCWETGGSASIMDTGTGLFLNAAAGFGKDENVRRLYGFAPGLDDTEDFYYAVAGIERNWFGIGPTTLFGQYWHRDIGSGVAFNGGPIKASGLAGLPFVSGADVTVFGASLVQTLGDGIDLYFSLNRTETEVRTSPTGGAPGSVSTKIEPFDFLLAGMAMRF